MTYLHQVWHVNVLGHMYGGAEQWTCGFWLGNEGGDAGVPTTADANAIANRWKTFMQASSSLVSWAFVANGIKISQYGTDGKVIKANTVFSTGGDLCVGGVQRNVPPQLALAVSFRGAFTRGPGANGRMYIPGIVNIPTATGHLDPGDMGPLSTALKTMFDGVNSDMNGRGVYLVNNSKGGLHPVSSPQIMKVTSIRIGDVVDTIQRRRNGLRESYTVKTLA